MLGPPSLSVAILSQAFLAVSNARSQKLDFLCGLIESVFYRNSYVEVGFYVICGEQVLLYSVVIRLRSARRVGLEPATGCARHINWLEPHARLTCLAQPVALSGVTCRKYLACSISIRVLY